MQEHDILRRFLFEELGVRGEWVKLGDSWTAAKKHQTGPEHAQNLLGQALAAVAMLSAIIKFNGSMVLQAQGDGDFKTLVAQSTHDRKVRGLIRCRPQLSAGPLEQMFGRGQLVLTIEPDDSDPYQGIVPLHGLGLAPALETYFSQSEQLKTRLWLFADQTRAGGLMLQELPAQGHEPVDWERIEMLAATVTERELLDLDCESLLHRLFHQEKVRLFDAERVAFQCACSRQRIERTLLTMGRGELEAILQERNAIDVGCEFCGAHYVFDRVNIKTLLSTSGLSYDSQTRH